MEQLSLLQKIYQYGETLSSEELNQIVQYLNSSIEAINTLIARNNNINEGHCEMRYKVSAQQPEAPESGTDGKSNGWSDTYTRPDTANGEITWMTLSFFNGEGVYGAWSTPVCITWGSVRGQAGPKGESGLKGSFKSRVFKRQNTRPDTPTGGTYDNPIPSEGGWTDGIPSGAAIIWSSVCTFYGNGLSSGWSVPASESDSDTLDIEFSPNAVQPEPPTGDTPFSNHESEGWYDPSSNNFNIVGTMIWRAERKVSNGEYNGDWTITRIVGEKGNKGDSGLTGGHYEFRYNNFKPSAQASSPTKPETGSNGTTNGWTTSQSTLSEAQIKDGYATWMTQCYQNESSTYGIWTDPIRITGANGEDGEDGIDIEFVYTRREDVWSNPTPPPTTQTDDWPTNGNNHSATVNGVTWYDNPQGVTEVLMYEYVSQRQKVDDVWSAYSTPVVWSKWGEKGMDGDGYEYIYKRFATPITWADANTDSSGSTQGKNDNPANWSTSASGYQNKEYIYSGSGWSDDPVGIDENNKYEYVSTREYRLWPNETEKRWGAYSTPTLWSGIPGGKTEYRYAKSKSSPTKPDAGTDGTASPWLASQISISESEFKDGYKAWMTQCFKTDSGTYGTWSDPIRISGANGLDGEDGSDIEFLYARTKTSTTPTKPSKPSSGDGSYTYEQVTRTWNDEDWGVGKTTGVAATDGDTTWSDNPRGVSNEIKYEWVIVRTKPTGRNTSFEDFSSPAIWSKYGEKGMDGDGVQYIFKLFDTELDATARSITYKPTRVGITQTDGEWIPSGWNDDPPTVSSEHPYCYCSTIKKTNGTWGDFETLSLWAKYSKDSNVAGPDGKGITYIVTRDTYTESTWSTYCAIGHSETFNRNSNSDQGSSCRVDDFFIVKGTATDGQRKFHQATFKCTAFDTSNITGTCVSHIKDGDKGDPGQSITGKTGPMFYIAGIWDSTKTYTKNDYKCPVVFLESNEKYYYLKTASNIGDNPSSSTSVWGEAENFAAVFTEVLFANFAKLGSFVINQDWMISQHGVEYDSSGNLTMVSGDNTTNYQNFKTSSPAENLSGEVNFCPNLAIDAKTGRVYAQRMDIGGSSVFKGTVHAAAGSFTGTVNATSLVAGDTTAMNIKTSSSKIEFCQGTNTIAYFEANGSGIQLHIWDSNGEEYTIDFTKWNAVNQGTFNNETWYQLGGASTGPTSATISLNSTDNKYYYNANTSSGLVNGTYYQKSDAKVSGMMPLDGTGVSREIFAPYVKAVGNKTYAIALNNVSKYTKYTFTNGECTATTDYLYHTTAYPNTITFSGDNVSSLTYKSTYLNPRSTKSVDFRWTPQLGTETYSQNVICAEAISSATHYSTSPMVYTVTLPSMQE